jgi:polygalacturonase
VTYSGITLASISGYVLSSLKIVKIHTANHVHRYGILIEQNYDGGDLDGGTPTSGIPITDLTIKNVDGTVESSGYNIVIVCGSGACSDWTWSGVDVTGGKTYSSCENVPSVASCS